MGSMCPNVFGYGTELDLKAESHCSDNENDNDHDAKRTHSIG